MEKKPTTQSHAQSPSLLGGFFEGAKSGAFNSTMMMGIFGGLSLVVNSFFPAFPVLQLGMMAMSVAASAIFSGALGAKKVYDVAHPDKPHPAPVRSQTRSHSPVRQQEVELSESPSHYRTDWAERTGRRSNNMQQILENGSTADRDYRTAVLQDRENEMGASTSRF